MDAWIPISIAAAAFQTARFMLQRRLARTGLTALGATFARFIWSAPLVGVAVLLWVGLTEAAFPAVPPLFWAYAGAGGLAQILATAATVSLFQHRNFAVGITFKKTEVIQTALLSILILGERLPLAALLAILIGLLGVILLSDPPESLPGAGIRRFFNRAAGLGLLSGVFFAVSAVGYRGASLSLESGDTGLRAAVTLALVTAGQAIGLALWLVWRSPGEVTRVLSSWRMTGPVGLLSLAGSYCWFVAFTLQSAAYVFALGQVEVIFSILASALLFGERIIRREMAGMALVLVSVVALVAVG